MISPDKIYLGTWQFEQIRDTRDKQAIVERALENSITHFDTAMVYDEGKAESILGDMLGEGHEIITKIPAVLRGSHVGPGISYPNAHVQENLERSAGRLNDTGANITVLLHNWNALWEDRPEQAIDMLGCLRESAQLKLGATKIGISIPNTRSAEIIGQSILSEIDVIETPLNKQYRPLPIDYLSSLDNVDILIRSIFNHGQEAENIKETLLEFNQTTFALVLGTSNPEQIADWISL